MPIDNFPSGLTELLDRGWVRSYPALDIFLTDDTTLRLSTVPVTVDSVSYEDRIDAVQSIKASRSRSVDYAELTIDNVDLDIGDTLFDDGNEDLLENMPAILSTIYVNINDPSDKYKIERMSGVMHSYSEEGTNALKMTLISDDYAGGPIAPYDVKESCVWQYKDGVNCTYSGDLATCDLSLSGPNGCIAHFGFDTARARFGGGATDLDERIRSTFQPYSAPSAPGPYLYNGGYGCFIGSTPIYVDESYATKPIREFTEKGEVILGFERDDLLPRPDRTLNPVFTTESRDWFQLIFSDGSEVTETHPFFPEPGKRVIVRDLEVGTKLRRLVDGKWRTVTLVNKLKRWSPFPMRFYNVPVEETHDYYANGFPVSNLKAAPGDDFPYSSFDSKAY
jgi:hypothetical protein